MALAEEQDLPILTFDFEHVRATRPRRGYWQLVVDAADLSPGWIVPILPLSPELQGFSRVRIIPIIGRGGSVRCET